VPQPTTLQRAPFQKCILKDISKIKIYAVDVEYLTSTKRNEVIVTEIQFREKTRVQNLATDLDEKRL
jgi:hypothetical protein